MPPDPAPSSCPLNGMILPANAGRPKYPRTSPCPTCPWWLHSDPTGEKIPGFDMNLMEDLVSTVGDRTDDFRPIMACHGSRDGDDHPCVGYLARHGYENLNVRLLAAAGGLDMPAIVDGDWEDDLFPDFDSMLNAYREAQQ